MSLPMPELAAALLIIVALTALTAVVVVIVREPDGATARHAVNLTLPLSLVPVFLALLAAGPRAGAGTAVLILVLQTITSVAESHLVGRVSVLTPSDEAPKAARHEGHEE